MFFQRTYCIARSLTSYTPGAGFASRTAIEVYDAGYNYDPNGNLLTLNRRDDQGAVASDFTYNYYAGTNKLQNLNGGADYEYDEIGNLVADPSQNVTSIDWTPYGKVRQVTKGDGTVVNFKYDASGNRIAKSTTTGGTTTTTRYIRDASGNVMAMYEEEALKSQPIYGSSRLGMYKGGNIAGERNLGNKHYELTNHLGNVLAVVTDNINMADDLTTGTVESATDYYPFGLEMAGRTFSAEDYRYGFNGKEKDQNGEFGNTHYDYGFRIYNPEIGKFLSMDPLMKNYPMLTPYQFASNRPIDGIDLDGLEFKRYELPEGSSQVKVMHPDDDAWQPDGWIHYGPSPKITFIQLHGVFDAYDVLSFTSKDGIEFNAELRPTETGRWYFSGYVDDQGNYFKGAANKLIAPYTPKIFIPEYNPDGSKIVHGAVIEFIAAIDFASNFTYGGMSKKGTQKAMNTMVRKAGKWKRLIDLPLQSHHLATKYGSYGRQFKRYFKRYGIGINDEINKLDLPHSGPHPTEYHEAILSKLKEVHKIAQGDVNVFKKEFKKRIKDWVADNPEVIHHTTKSIN